MYKYLSEDEASFRIYVIVFNFIEYYRNIQDIEYLYNLVGVGPWFTIQAQLSFLKTKVNSKLNTGQTVNKFSLIYK